MRRRIRLDLELPQLLREQDHTMTVVMADLEFGYTHHTRKISNALSLVERILPQISVLICSRG